MIRRCRYCEGRERHSYVYVMHGRGDGWVKVGYAVHPSKRASALTQVFGSRITPFARFETCCEYSAMDVEDRVHRALSKVCAYRGDWFSCAPEVAAEAIAKIMRRRA